MAQIVFLDTGVILDYLENRNPDVRRIVETLLQMAKEGSVVLATSVFNIAEAIDKEFDIHFGGWGLSQKMSFDEISRMRRDSKLFTEISGRNKGRIQKNVDTFASQEEITVFSLPPESQQYEQLYNLIYKYQLQSQDALIVAAAIANATTYFLSNDLDLIVKIRSVLDGYNLRDESSRNAFRSNVLRAIG